MDGETGEMRNQDDESSLPRPVPAPPADGKTSLPALSGLRAPMAPAPLDSPHSQSWWTQNSGPSAPLFLSCFPNAIISSLSLTVFWLSLSPSLHPASNV